MSKTRELSEILSCQDPLQMANDLIEFYNTREEDLDDDDLKLLAHLCNSDRFTAWNCPTCGERVYQATPEDWMQFQGCSNPDYVSFPEGHKKQCDDCRMRTPLTSKQARSLGLAICDMLEPISHEESMQRLMSAFRI